MKMPKINCNIDKIDKFYCFKHHSRPVSLQTNCIGALKARFPLFFLFSSG